MKTKRIFYPVCMALCLAMIISCTPYDYVVESDYSYKGRFNKYRTFNFATNNSFKGTEKEKVIIENLVGKRFEAWGYRETVKRPDLIVFYTFYLEDLSFKGFDQPQFEQWVSDHYSDSYFKEDTTSLDFPEFYTNNKGEKYFEKSYDMQEGTLLVSLYDGKKKGIVWQGYASGIFGENDQKNERVLRSAVYRILDRFRLLAFQSS